MRAAPELDEYLALLRRLPFVRAVHAQPAQKRGRGAQAKESSVEPDAQRLLKIRTKSGSHQLRCIVSERPVHASAASFALDRSAGAHEPLIVLAPYVGPTAARLLVEHHVNFVDLLGNCYLALGDQYLALLEKAGPPPKKPAESRALRAPAYRVLFALLVKPEAIGQTTRVIAELAGGVSPQTVADLRAKLVARGSVLRRGAVHRFAPGGFQRALELFVHGFSTTLWPSLAIGRFRAQSDVQGLITVLAPLLNHMGGAWAVGGGAAAERLTSYYRGERTLIYLERPVTNPVKQLGLVPDTKGPVLLARSPGPLAFQSPHAHVVHPLLAYVDLLAEEHDRATEAARVLYTEYLVQHEQTP